MRRRRFKGTFIVLEGIDGAGTTTQGAMAAASLRQQSFAVLQTGEPSEGPIGALIRQALKGRVVLPAGSGPMTEETLALLFAADRLDHLEAQILPALAQGQIVLCDRYLLSSLAYQGAACPMGWVEEINRHAVSPDLTIFISAGVKAAARRRASRGGAPELFESEERQRRVTRQYALAIARRARRERIVQVNGDRSRAEVGASVWEAMRSVLPQLKAKVQ
jgi:dTMP kinase